jgi:methylated-DNA-[protein]-cysteine S-methyltransferase
MTTTLATPTCWDQIRLDFPAATIPAATMPTATMEVVIAGDGERLLGLRFGTAADHAGWLGGALRHGDDPVLAEAARQLRAYAAGTSHRFDVPLSLAGSDFQRAVWAALREIPYGTTTTYGAVASAIGRPGQARAIGTAVGANPVGIIVPCHRVIGADGSLTGFAGGLGNKTTLLAREGVTAL